MYITVCVSKRLLELKEKSYSSEDVDPSHLLIVHYYITITCIYNI